MASVSRHPRRSIAVVLVLGFVLALTASACSNAGSASGAPTAAGGSGSQACATAPTPPPSVEGWGPPADAPDVFPVIVNVAGQLVCGPNRVLFTVTDKTGRPVGTPDRSVKVDFFNLGRDAAKPVASVDGKFVWAIEDERGIYVANVDFPEAGVYGAAFTTAAAGGTPETLRLTFDVQPSTQAVRVGDRAPASKTTTLSDVGGDVKKISTDATPDRKLYETSVDQAVAGHRPFALIFATPKFCTSAQCGPTLDRVKPFVARYPTVTFINVEPYRLKLVDGALQADTDGQGQLQTTKVAEQWHLVVEPTVYVVDRDGIVRANFDLIFSDDELIAALDAVK